MSPPVSPSPPVPRGRDAVAHGRRGWSFGDVVVTVLRVASVMVAAIAIWVLGDVVWSNTGANGPALSRQMQVAQTALDSWVPAPRSVTTQQGGSAGSIVDPPALEPAEAAIPVLVRPAEPGETFARLYIPALGSGWMRPVAEGIGTDVLDSIGVGHYDGSAYPGEVGNVGLAAHRTTHGAAFFDLDLLVPGDAVIVETVDGFYTYLVDSADVVAPDAVEVVAPVPNQPGATPTERWLTLTTCTPKYTTLQRLVVWARFDSFTVDRPGDLPRI